MYKNNSCGVSIFRIFVFTYSSYFYVSLRLVFTYFSICFVFVVCSLYMSVCLLITDKLSVSVDCFCVYRDAFFIGFFIK